MEQTQKAAVFKKLDESLRQFLEIVCSIFPVLSRNKHASGIPVPSSSESTANKSIPAQFFPDLESIASSLVFVLNLRREQYRFPKLDKCLFQILGG